MTKKHFRMIAYRLAMQEPDSGLDASDLWERILDTLADADTEAEQPNPIKGRTK